MSDADGPPVDGERPQRWRGDFPVRWDDDHYLTRRELARFLALGSGLLAITNLAIALVGRRVATSAGPEMRIAAASVLAPGQSLLFRYPTDADPCILLRLRDGTLAAYSQVCTHVSCAVVHRSGEDALFCPCHRGAFDGHDGRPISGPPTRRLPRIRIEQRGVDVFATGVEA